MAVEPIPAVTKLTPVEFGDGLWAKAKATWPESVIGCILFVVRRELRNEHASVKEWSNTNGATRTGFLEHILAVEREALCEHVPVATADDVRKEVLSAMDHEILRLLGKNQKNASRYTEAALAVFLQHYHLVPRKP